MRTQTRRLSRHRLCLTQFGTLTAPKKNRPHGPTPRHPGHRPADAGTAAAYPARAQDHHQRTAPAAQGRGLRTRPAHHPAPAGNPERAFRHRARRAQQTLRLPLAGARPGPGLASTHTPGIAAPAIGRGAPEKPAAGTPDAVDGGVLHPSPAQPGRRPQHAPGARMAAQGACGGHQPAAAGARHCQRRAGSCERSAVRQPLAGP